MWTCPALGECVAIAEKGAHKRRVKLQATCNMQRPWQAGADASDHKGLKCYQTTSLLADKGYDADWFREGLQKKGIAPCTPPQEKSKMHDSV